MALTQDLFHDSVVADPYAYYGHIRDTDPVVWNEEFGVWLATDYDSVSSVLRKSFRYSSQIFVRDTRPPSPPIRPEDAKDFEEVQEFFGRTMSVMDPPDHTGIRRSLQRPFTVRSLDQYRGMIGEETSRLLSEAGARGGSIEFVTDIAMPFPILVIARILGVPERYREEIRDFAAGFHSITRSEPDRMHVAAVGIKGFKGLIGQLIETKQRHPDDDLLSHLAQLVNEETMSHEDAVANAALLLSAGHETTANLISNGLVNLLRHDQIWSQVATADEPLIKGIVEECLRFDGPVTSFLRIATEDTTLGGKPIRRGERVRWFISSANRDPSRFERPDEFLLGRSGTGHLSFGNGIHFCLGANLARLEAQVFFKVLATEYPNPRIATTNPTYQKSISFRALERLDVQLG
jgi:cytochrome P450